MSGRTAKAKRRAERAASEDVTEIVIATAERVLAFDFAGVPVTRVTQFVIGWICAAFEQSRAIAALKRAGLAHAGAPNRRSFAEILVRFQWLYSMDASNRLGALDAMIEDEKRLERNFYGHLAEMGYDSDVDLSDMEAVITEPIADPQIAAQARRFLDAAKATEGAAIGLYYAWRAETQCMHATAALAAAYAPAGTSGDVRTQPPVVDPDLETHRMATMLAISLAYGLLVDEGVAPESAKKLVAAFFDGRI